MTRVAPLCSVKIRSHVSCFTGKYNAWSKSLCDQMITQFARAAADADTKVKILVSLSVISVPEIIFRLSSTLGPTPTSVQEEVSPNCSLQSHHQSIIFNIRKDFYIGFIIRAVQRNIQESNERCFNVFIEFPKPIIAAVNGPGIGSGTTAPALCDVILASERASFSTPFSALGVGPEGCASVHFQRILGGETARRLLEEGWKPSAQEARDVGLVSEVVAHDDLLARAQVRKIISVPGKLILTGTSWAGAGRGLGQVRQGQANTRWSLG